MVHEKAKLRPPSSQHADAKRGCQTRNGYFPPLWWDVWQSSPILIIFVCLFVAIIAPWSGTFSSNEHFSSILGESRFSWRIHFESSLCICFCLDCYCIVCRWPVSRWDLDLAPHAHQGANLQSITRVFGQTDIRTWKLWGNGHPEEGNQAVHLDSVYTFSHASTKPVSHVGVDYNRSRRNSGKEQFLASVSCSLAWRKRGVNHSKYK